MVQEEAAVEPSLPLALGLGVCTTCLLLLMGLKLRWFRARMRVGTSNTQPAILAGTYRSVVNSDSFKNASTQPQHHQSMPNLTSGYQMERKTPKAINNSIPAPKQAMKNGSVVPAINNAVLEEVERNKMLSPVPSSKKHMGSNKNPIVTTPRSKKVRLEVPHKKPRAPDPKAIVEATPLMFNDGRVNHRADRLESIHLVPEVGVPFARGNPLPSFAVQNEQPSPSQSRHKASPISKSTNDLSDHKLRENRDSIGSFSETEMQQFTFIIPANKQENTKALFQPAFHEYEEYES